ncbi:MAG: DUF3999 family protein [Candidatus Acidiferrales bacterium]
MTNSSRQKWSSPRFAAALLAIPFLAAAPLPTAWNHWRYSRAIDLPPTDNERFVSVIVPQEVYTHVQPRLHDVRVIDDGGEEIPFVTFTHEGAKNTRSLSTAMRENSFTPGLYTQVILDTGAAAPFHNGVEIRTPESDFIEWVGIDVSDDARIWRIVQERAPIFRFQKENRQGTQLVRYSENNARYLRVRILDGKEAFVLSGASVLYEIVDPPERAAIVANVALDPSPPAGKTVWRIDLGTTALNIKQVQFTVAPSEFSRNVEIATSETGSDWSPFASGEIYRFHQQNTVREQLAVDVPSYTTRRFWRVTILNGNDAPLPGVTPALYMTPRHIVFEQLPERSYRMLYGQALAKAPAYDLERRLDSATKDAAVPGQLRGEELNSAWSDPRPWTEKYDVLLWIALGFAVLLLGYSAIRSLRRSAQDPST